MSLILNLPDHPSLREMLETISTAEELCDKSLRTSEKAIYNKLRNHLDIRFEVKKIEKTSDKAFLLIQAVLGGIGLKTEFKGTDSQPYLEALSLFRHAPRIARAVVEVAVAKKVGTQVKHGLELVRCLTAKAWEDRPIVLKQVEHIGEKSIKVDIYLSPASLAVTIDIILLVGFGGTWDCFSLRLALSDSSEDRNLTESATSLWVGGFSLCQ